MAGNIIHKTTGRNHLIIVLLFLVIAFSSNIYSQGNDSSGFMDKISSHLKKGALLLSGEYNLNMSLTDYSSSTTSSGFRAMGKYILPINDKFNYGVGLFFGFGSLTGIDLELKNDPRGFPDQFETSIKYFGLGIELNYKVNSNIYPYLFLSLTELYFQPKDIYGNPLPNNAQGSLVYSPNALEPGIEIGARYFIFDYLAANASFTYYLFPNDYLDDLKKAASNDKYASINIGLSYAPFMKGSDIKDSDSDGIEDVKDACPGTPEDVIVDNFGCPVDSDNDGVPDYLDKCPETLPRVKVDLDGCPLDSDKDEVPDYLDKCPNTLSGLKVDSAGCPLDYDKDGVPDYLDKCPDTPPGSNVDSTGCAAKIDSSKTKEVPEKDNENVRIIPPSELKSVVLYTDTYFGPDKEKLLPKAYTLLDILANTMKAYPESKWNISGYTDSTGTDNKNLALSKKAAQTVADYLIGKGVNPGMLEVVGYGEKNPVFSNDFPEGRALNRRVEIKYMPGK